MKMTLGEVKLLRLVVTLVVGLVIWFIPAPAGVDIKAWHLLAIFVATVVGIIAQPIPMGAAAVLGITVTALTGTLAITQALSGFGNRVIWLIAIAFFISRGFIKTGIGARIAYLFMAAVGKKSLGLAYGMVATDLVLAPAIPSNTVRAGGVIMPILRSVAKAYGSKPDDGTARPSGPACPAPEGLGPPKAVRPSLRKRSASSLNGLVPLRIIASGRGREGWRSGSLHVPQGAETLELLRRLPL